MRRVFLLTAIPMALCVVLLVLGVREAPAVRNAATARVARLPRRYWAFLGVASLFALEGVLLPFLLLRALSLGADVVQTLALYIAFNVVYAAASVPFGRLSDRVGRGPVLAGAFALAAAVSAGFAVAPTLLWAVPLFIGYGLFEAAHQGVARAFVVDLAPAQARATALGAYHAVTGLAALPLGIGLGLAWEREGPPAAFALAALVAAVTAIALHMLARKATTRT